MTDIESRLENWRICLKDTAKYNKAMSLEGNYKEPPLTKEQKELLEKTGQTFESKTSARAVKDLKDAFIVERAVIHLPKKHGLVLVCDYMYHYLLVNGRFNATCNNIGISRKYEVWEEHLKDAKKMLSNLLTK